MSAPRRVLLLAGSTEATDIARRGGEWLAGRGAAAEIVASFAGRTTTRVDLPPAVRVRVGGFGGAHGLAAFLEAEGIAAVVDATHPFSARMPFNALGACDAAGTPRLRLLRPPWGAQVADRWIEVDDPPAAARAVAASGARRALLTIGRQGLAAFLPGFTPGSARGAPALVVRTIEPPGIALPPGSEAILQRGPFAVADEVGLMRERGIDLLVSKNAGGAAARAKIDAARELGIPVVMIRRPPSPQGSTVATVDDALAWLRGAPNGSPA